MTTLRTDGSPHVVPVGVTYDPGSLTARVITSDGSAKVRHVEAGKDRALVAVCQVDGRRWSTLEGIAVVRREPTAVATAVRWYAERYQQPRANPRRVVIEIAIRRILGSW